MNQNKLQQDLQILENMVAQMNGYIDSSTIFGQAMTEKVSPTIGGYLLRRHRLQGLTHLLSGQEQAHLQQTVTQMEQIVQQKYGPFQTKLTQELGVRIRQWDVALGELLDDFSPVYYRVEVEKRLMLYLLAAQVEDAQATEDIEELDEELQQRWQSGSFVWAEEWSSAYSPQEFWWLYGRIR